MHRRIIAMFAVAALALGSCSSGASPTTAPTGSAGGTTAPASAPASAAASGGAITIAEVYEQPSLDPAVDAQAASDEMNALYDTLVVQNADGTFGPSLATSWTQTLTDITFHLRTGVKFHDGTTFDAQAVKDFLDRVHTPAGSASNAAGVSSPYDHSTVIDPNTVQVFWSSPFSTALIDFSFDSLGIPSPTAAKAGTLGDHPVGTGPFQFVEWVKGDHLTLKKNPTYSPGRTDITNHGPAYLDQITFVYSNNATTRANLLTTGKVQLTRVDGPDAARLMSSTDLTHLLFPNVFVRWFAINTKHITDINVRTAIVEAIDRKAVIAASGGLAAEHYSLLPSPAFGWDKDIDAKVAAILPKYDPAHAKQLLAQAGYTPGSDGVLQKDGKELSLDFLTFTGDPYKGEAQVIQDELSQVGIKTTIRALEATAIIAARRDGKQDLYLGRYGILDPVLEMQYVLSCASIPDPVKQTGVNVSWYCNETFDKDIAEMLKTNDSVALKALVQKSQLDLTQGNANFVLYNVTDAYFFSNSLTGVAEVPDGGLKVNDLKLSK
jgi:peptide/nickel transport system substrate-binding protein